MTTELPDKPLSRKESYLAAIAGESVELPEVPESRTEQYLAYIAENGGGGGGGTNNFNQLTNRPKYNGTTMTGSTNIPEVKSYSAGTGLKLTGTAFSVDTTTIQPKLTAGSNVTISDNTISATDTTYSNFTGTDGTSAGVAGLVPAPATTDAGKFLKADGTWDTAGGGSGPTVVQSTGTSTTDVMSQNATTSMVFADPSTKNRIQIGSSAYAPNDYNIALLGSADTATSIAIGSNASATGRGAIALGRSSSASTAGEMNIGTSDTTAGYNSSNYRLLSGVYDGQNAHDAATKGQLDSIAIQNAGAPTTSTVGTVGQLLEDTTNGKLYICTDTTGGSYTWAEVGAGGGGGAVTELTSADYDYPTNNPTSVALWLLPAGMYYAKDSVNISTSSSTSKAGGLYNVAEVVSGVVVWYGMYSPTPSETVMLYGRTEMSTGNEQTNASKTVATLSNIFADPSTMSKIKIGDGTSSSQGNNAVEIGHYSASTGTSSVAIGGGSNAAGASQASASGAIALGAGARATVAGQFDIGSASNTNFGYNSSNYRLLTGLYDGQSNHDAATVAQGNKLMSAAPTTTDAGVLGQLWTDTTNMHTYQLTAIDTTDPDNPSYTWTQRW